MRRGDTSGLDSILLPPALKWKTAYLYQDQAKPAVVSIYAGDALRYVAFGDPSARRSLGEAHAVIVARKPVDIDIREFEYEEWARWVSYQGLGEEAHRQRRKRMERRGAQRA